MSSKSKNSLATLAAAALLAVGYCLYAFGPSAPAPGDVRSWSLVLLVFVAITIITLIVVQIVFRILLGVGIAATRKDAEPVERVLAAALADDEMDRLIGARAARVGAPIVGFGFLLTLGMIAAGGSVVGALHVQLAAFFAAGLTSAVVSIIGYERGIADD